MPVKPRQAGVTEAGAAGTLAVRLHLGGAPKHPRTATGEVRAGAGLRHVPARPLVVAGGSVPNPVGNPWPCVHVVHRPPSARCSEEPAGAGRLPPRPPCSSGTPGCPDRTPARPSTPQASSALWQLCGCPEQSLGSDSSLGCSQGVGGSSQADPGLPHPHRHLPKGSCDWRLQGQASWDTNSPLPPHRDQAGPGP